MCAFIRDAVARTVLDAPIAGGAGWTVTGPGSWLYLSSPGNPPSGIEKIKLVARGGIARFKIMGKGGSFANFPVDPPFEAVLFFAATGGTCADARPACAVRSDGEAFTCH